MGYDTFNEDFVLHNREIIKAYFELYDTEINSNLHITEYLNKAIEQLGESISSYMQSNFIPNDIVSLESFEQSLGDFCEFVKNDKRMTFWKSNSEKKKHNWIPSPEQHRQDLLHTFIKARYGNNVEIMEEVCSGAG